MLRISMGMHYRLRERELVNQVAGRVGSNGTRRFTFFVGWDGEDNRNWERGGGEIYK